MDKKHSNQETLKRRVSAYPPPKQFELLEQYRREQGITKSAAATEMIKAFFDNMPAEQLARLRARARSKNSY